MKRFIGICAVVVGIVLCFFYWTERNTLTAITLTSPRNTALYNKVDISLARPAPVYIEYTERNTGKTYRTRTSPADTLHHLDLLLLKANTEYTYRVVVDNLFKQKTKELIFKTREQSPWLVNRWHDEKHPHDPSALGDGMILVCFGRLPGYMALLDNEGEIRWYWQVDDIGVRAASLTPRGTFLAMLRPFVKDFVDDYTMSPEQVRQEEDRKPMRRGSIGFAGGTGLAEISLTGELLWRLDLDKIQKEKDYQVIHHDILMDENHHIHTLYRPKKVATIPVNGRLETDTLGGDGILVMDTLGTILKKWSAWDVWDIEKDPYIGEYRYDRFHINGLCFDKDGNYLLSAPIEDQIWKVDAEKGNIVWRFGRNGDFEMDTTAYFSFQHSPYLTEDGDLMLFDNGLFTQRSGAKAFRLDEKSRTAKTVINAMLPPDKYTSRMGNAFLLPNGNLLQCSSKTGSILVTDKAGQVLWESIMPYAPYRAIYVPMEMFKSYFTEID